MPPVRRRRSNLGRKTRNAINQTKFQNNRTLQQRKERNEKERIRILQSRATSRKAVVLKKHVSLLENCVLPGAASENLQVYLLSRQMPEYTVTSEIYDEFDYKTDTKASQIGNVISEFPFLLPKSDNKKEFDEDDDLVIERPQKEVIKIEHSSKTKISLVGLQVWRGAFLLGDLLIHLGQNGGLSGKTVLELGAGTGLASFVAAIYAKKVVCTDIDVGGILDLIRLNVKYNSKLVKSQFKVMPLDFKNTDWSRVLLDEINKTEIIIAADVIYDDDVTAAFVSTIKKILNTNPPKTLYMVLEKRYVFTIEHTDSVAPCYETFLTLLDKVKTDVHSNWTVEELPLDFPKYFTYERVKDLVLWKISSKIKAG